LATSDSPSEASPEEETKDGDWKPKGMDGNKLY
jgi:hypothetical protein